MAISRTQLYYLTGAAALTVALYFAIGETPVKNETATVNEEQQSSDGFESMLSTARSSLKRQEASTVASLEGQLKATGGSDTAILARLGRTWDGFNSPAISAHYFELIAEKNPGEKEWLNAAYRYFDAFKLSGDSSLRASMVQKAIDSYKQVLQLNPENLDAKTDLGVCYAEGTPQPMQGIMLLREVVQADPRHEQAQYNLGILSVKSGQLDKAVDRFSHVLEINPKNHNAGFLLGRCYAQLGQREKAMTALQAVKNGSTDPELLQQTDELIHQISINQ